MHPVVLVVLAAAVLAVSGGYFGATINLDGMVQLFGAGETNVERPVSTVDVTIKIERTGNSNNFKDLITECSFTTPTDILAGSILICKLLDMNGSILAEGRLGPTGFISAGTKITIPIEDFFLFTNSNKLDGVADIMLIIQGP